MSTENYSPEKLLELARESSYGDEEWLSAAVETFNRQLGRGDKIAVYENHDLGHPEMGHRKYVSYGSPAAYLEVDEPPQRLPDTPQEINWRYALIGVCTEGPVVT